MDLFLTLAFLFFLGSLLGWVLELLFRRFFSAKKWINPGFLVGPYLPLYGFGTCLLFLLASVPITFLPGKFLPEVLRILMMGAAMTLIEYIAGKIFIVGMHIKLWDYSKKPGNIQGIVCPEFTLYWTLLAALYCYGIHPFLYGAVGWLFDNLAFSFVVGMFYGVFLIDVAWSFQLMARVRKFAAENHLVIRLENLKKSIAERKERWRFSHFVFALKDARPLPETLREYAAQLKQKTQNRRREETPVEPDDRDRKGDT